MGVHKTICDVCEKETNEFVLLDEIDMCENCFETIVRVSQFKKLDDATDEEKMTIMAYLKNHVTQLFQK
jgi:hypothetical protein